MLIFMIGQVAHRRGGVIDPMTGSLMRVPGNGNPLGPQACQRTHQIFDGRMRYNLQFAYKRMEQVKADKGYEGPAVVCSVSFVPLAGYNPTRTAIKYLIAQHDMEIWLAPIGATRVLVPFRVSIPTPIGVGVMQATQFVATTPAPHSASPPPSSSPPRRRRGPVPPPPPPPAPCESNRYISSGSSCCLGRRHSSVMGKPRVGLCAIDARAERACTTDDSNYCDHWKAPSFGDTIAVSEAAISADSDAA